MMTRKHYHRLFNWIYLISLALCILFCILCEYLAINRHPIGEPLLTSYRKWEFFGRYMGMFFFALPVLITCVVAGLIRLTNKLEPLTDEERAQSFIGRMSKTQIFLPLSLLLLVPIAWQMRVQDMYAQVWVLYLFAAGHLLVAWLLTLFLKRITRIRKTAWKITAILGFIFSGLLFSVVEMTALYTCSIDDYEYSDRYPDDYDTEEAEEADPNADLDEAFASVPENLASNMVNRMLEVYNHWDGRPAMLADAADVFLHYDSERTNFGGISYPSDATEEEIRRKTEKDNRYFDNEQELGRMFRWIFSDMDYSDHTSLLDLLKKLFMEDSGRYDYAQFAKRVDMLDWAYRDLMDKGNAAYEYEGDGEVYFYNIYQHAGGVPLKWENYGKYIDNPYVRYTVEDNERDQYLLMWAYTFWGRRYDDETYWQCRELLDKVLEAHPNTLYPEDKIDKQNELMRAAEARVAEFIKWYKANYWSFRELKVAKYDGTGNLVKLDRDEYAKYLYALEKSGYVSPTLIKELQEWLDLRSKSVETGRVREEQGEWLRVDPLIYDYNVIAGEIDDLTCRTDHISKPGQNMWIATSIDRLFAGVEILDGKWMMGSMVLTGN